MIIELKTTEKLPFQYDKVYYYYYCCYYYYYYYYYYLIVPYNVVLVSESKDEIAQGKYPHEC